MLEKDLEYAINTHPNAVTVSYKGTVTVGVLDVMTDRLYDDNMGCYYVTSYTLTYLSSKLPVITTKTDKDILIGSKYYIIKSYTRESNYITVLHLEDKK